MSKRTYGHIVCNWLEQNCVFTNGKWRGKPFRLLPWQRTLIYDLFSCDEAGVRQYRWAYISVAKKNGKTELLAALALWFLLASGEPSPLIVCAAGSDDQADLLFNAARTMAEDSPTLSALVDCYESELVAPSIPGGKIARVSATARKNSSNLDGKNIFVVICDELHVWEGERGATVWGTLTRGTVARSEPFVIQITTAGYDRESICYKQYQHAKKVLHDQSFDPAYYAYVVEAPDDSKHDVPAVWADANPSYGEIASEAFYADQVTKQPEFEFRRFYLNQWTESTESWLPAGAWENCYSELEIPEHSPIHVGLDAAIYSDTTSVVWAWDNEGTKVVRSKVFTQGANGSIDLQEVKRFVLELSSSYDVKGISYDPRFFELVAQELLDQGLPMIRQDQSAARMIPACRHAYEQIASGQVAHSNDPDLSAHVKAAAIRPYDNGWTLSKGKSKHVIDACIALVLALYLIEQLETPQQFNWMIV